MSPRKSHVHKYHLRKTENRPVWACALIGCNHFMPVHLTPLVNGRTSICWGCEQLFVINELNMLNPKPLCDDCSGLNEKLKELNKKLGNI